MSTDDATMSIDTSLNSDIISVTLRWPDKTTAATVLDRYIELYLRFRSTLFESDQEVLFLEHQRDGARQQPGPRIRAERRVEKHDIEGPRFSR